MVPTPVKLVALAVAMAGAVVLSLFSRYRCGHHPNPFLHNGTRRLIVVSNEQEVGEEMDLADGNVQLLCLGFGEHYSHSVWTQRANIPSGGAAHLTLPAVRGDEVFEVRCSYRGANQCWAHGVLVFVNPGHDNLFCSEHLGGCTVRFRKDGGVEKQYETAGDAAVNDRPDVQPPIFMGFVPDFDNARDGGCASASCIGRTINRVIGEESCCDDSCGGWEKASPKK
ncbi:hypothetical protein PR202_gb11271 [Eleusine coracana subsp. coracana]|uniref:Uncharacterized protein n=1 Tax=Eleusine coracana subsp. coracana TaxID=191504 RepID=A0AAV5EM94_ELECO|nr:hypothetical protein QOZ80_3BG0265030 [Eleusine coracana subsp. coracana]GJN23607.1 hypothetical protein PR202_gb11271 [Eleusine coracana subsp. coracana]